jgi:mannitol 2-dehydrogenase
MVSPEIRIVSLTVTEGGYYTNSASNDFNIDHPDIIKDIANPTSPRTVFGVIVEALRLRRQLGYGPFTGLCCDNLEQNGAVMHRAVTKLAEHVDSDLAAWINEKCSFPCSMVDCIVPSTGTHELELVQKYNLNDSVPVTHENFRQWVIEDDFCAGRPDLEKVGVIFTKNVHYHETMKIRLLNGGHQIIANAGELLSLVTISSCMKNNRIVSLLLKILSEEIAPYVLSVPDTTPEEYIELIVKRFSNSSVVDTTRRVAFDGSSRHPGFLVPSIRTALEAGSSISGLALAEAIWARMCEGTREDGSKIEPNDPNWSELQRTAKISKEKSAAWLGQRQYYGDLDSNKVFSNAFSNWLQEIWDSGVESAIDAYLQ